MSRYELYKNIDELEKTIENLRKKDKLFSVGDEVYGVNLVLGLGQKIKPYKIDTVFIDDDTKTTSFWVSDETTEGMFNERDIFFNQKDAIKRYNTILWSCLEKVIYHKLGDEWSRIEFLLETSTKLGDVFLSLEFKKDIVKTYIEVLKDPDSYPSDVLQKVYGNWRVN